MREIPSLPGYAVSDTGEVRGRSGRFLKQARQNGYACLTIDIDRRAQKHYVHVLVCEAFHGPRPAGKEVAHANGIRDDNRACNLSWKTRAENHHDKREHGTHRQGEEIVWAKLTEAKVREIKASTESTVVLGKRYGVTPAAITHIRSGRNWKHVR